MNPQNDSEIQRRRERTFIKLTANTQSGQAALDLVSRTGIHCAR